MVEFEVPEIDYDQYSNRQLAAVPLAVLAVAIAVLVGAYLLTGSPVALGIEFTGGSQLTVETTMSQSQIESTFTPRPVSVQGVGGQPDTYVLTFDAEAQNVTALRDQAQAAGMTVLGSGETPASFGQQSQRIALLGLVVAFVGMSVLAFALFRTFVPSIAIVISAFSDIVIPLAILSLLQVKLSLGTVAAFLMLIGYSVDSDILLNNHVLRRRGEFYESTYAAMQTGVTMTLTSIAAMAVMAVMATFYNIDLMAQIGLVLVLGLTTDLMNVRENWRIVLLVVFVTASTVMLFVPGAVPGSSGGQGPTNLQYGIQLEGGTRLQAPPVGITAEGVNVSADREAALASNVSDALSVDRIDVRVSAQSNTVEVFVKNVTHEELRSVLEAQGYQPSTVRDGVTQQTREEMVRVISDKLRQSALDSGSVSTIRSTSGQQFVSITAPDRDREELVSLLDERGVVRVYAFVPAENGTYVRHQVLSQDDFARISPAETQQGQAVVPVTIRQSVARRYQQEMVKYGFDQQTVCNYDREEPQNTRGRCLLATLNGEVVFAGGVDRGLAQLYASGEFAENPVFQMETRNISEARELEISLRAGRLPAPLNFEQARSTELEPALAQRFKTNSLITGILAVLAVSGMVYLRYRNPRVALPMIVTALSEVVILLGFVSFVQYALNLSHIAGFIAVIGTGVDDLIIIADEILQQGEVATGRVFQNRFRKAFWVIGAAAATTIIAMSPLTVLGLGDLSGFAIITIVGVLVGVLVTRPAYGDILRNLILRQDRDDD